jgi:hypothetical protein
VLFAEIVLDNVKNRKLEFLYDLNEFLKNYEDARVRELVKGFTENDLKNLPSGWQLARARPSLPI